MPCKAECRSYQERKQELHSAGHQARGHPQPRRRSRRLLYIRRSPQNYFSRHATCRQDDEARCSKKKKILRYLKEVSGKVVLPKDVENLITKMRKETYTSEDDNVRVAQVLQDFSEGPGNAVDVFRDKSTGLTTCITFQTAHMRRMVGKFPEAVCVDSTYGTNINRYRLFSFMITDKFGCGAFAQHSLVDGESRLNIECAVRAFKQNNAE
ncbi:hypothetical protein L915_08625 [Phytophthora nicotianae]|uniref:ZSWIM1/3 RNaseH-like domain-containing protein n=1 Tax=Phytophthora nicotianae TaxID=4792 RepID=W2J3P4_PHYNI|nr:hypothetical protein L915_08625 [Phytophthora nicotianae]ETL40233.1 hypothetical protein L916_08553 [Phytophthora nicotianae]